MRCQQGQPRLKKYWRLIPNWPPHIPCRVQFPQWPVSIPTSFAVDAAAPLFRAEAFDVDDMLALDDVRTCILDQPVPDGQRARLRACVAGAREAAVERDSDLLTPDGFQEHAAAVSAAA
eukprot:8080883-Pyramimonas_sp.AAC.1